MIHDDLSGGFVSLSKSSGKWKKENRFFVLLKGWRLKPPASLLCSLVTRKRETTLGSLERERRKPVRYTCSTRTKPVRCTGLIEY